VSPSFHIATFGCKVNQYDSEVVREALLGAGWAETDRDAPPDVIVVNTCTVTGTADAKARRAIRRLARQIPGARIIVTGCGVTRDAGQFAELSGVAALLPNDRKREIVETARRLAGSAGKANASLPGVADLAGHTRAFVKAQDGCDAFCAYCIVPHVRGAPRSRPLDEVVAEIARLAARFHEVVLSGIHVGMYRDASGADLAALVRAALRRTPLERLRLSSIEVGELTPELLDLIAGSDRLCPHVHLPLQSGSDGVLRRMNRRYTAAEFLDAVGCIRERLDRPGVTTDVIVGLPGETEADFAETVRVARAAAFSRMHIFPFSPRPGTPAATMPDAPPPQVVAERRAELGRVADALGERYRRRFVGEILDVLVETTRDRSGRLCGYTPRYLRVAVDGSDDLRGRLVPVRAERAVAGALFGVAQPEKA
jgi:threonylcarbamoyladenosine tRNA methylthiotransferase MtaB